MEKENLCKELYELLKKLKPDTIIYETNRHNYFYFIAHIDGKLFFSIPKHKNSSIPYKKSVLDKQFCELLEKLIKKSILTKEDFPFQDCRKSAFYGFINILYPNRFIKKLGKILLIQKK